MQKMVLPRKGLAERHTEGEMLKSWGNETPSWKVLTPDSPLSKSPPKTHFYFEGQGEKEASWYTDTFWINSRRKRWGITAGSLCNKLRTSQQPQHSQDVEAADNLLSEEDVMNAAEMVWAAGVCLFFCKYNLLSACSSAYLWPSLGEKCIRCLCSTLNLCLPTLYVIDQTNSSVFSVRGHRYNSILVNLRVLGLCPTLSEQYLFTGALLGSHVFKKNYCTTVCAQPISNLRSLSYM